MPDGKPDIDVDLDDDPFEGLELAADAPEPTQEEMDEWATLDTPDEDASPTFGARSASPAGPVANAPVPQPQGNAEDKKEELTGGYKCKEEHADTPKGAAPLPTPASAAPPLAALEAKTEALPATAGPQAKEIIVSAPSTTSSLEASRTAELSEITPWTLPPPPPPQRTSKDQNFGFEEEYDEEDEVSEGERSKLLAQQQQERHQQRGSGGGGWGVGWGTGWGLGALGGKLREVAAGAVRDVKDLTETFQAALADVTGAEDEVEQARRISAMDRAAEAAAAGVLAPEEGEEDGGAEGDAKGKAAPALPTEPPLQAAEPARDGAFLAATRARGSAGGAAGSTTAAAAPSSPEDPALEAGLQAIDAQVEQLASGAARAFSSLWGGLSSVAKVVAAEVAASVADVQSIEAVRGVAQIGTKLAHTAEKGLETVGRTAMVLLEEVAGVGGVGGGHSGRRRIWGEEADARAADMGREPASFQDFFYIYGGEQLSEEVNNLSNECAHLCNKSRSRLEGDQQQALDEALALLGPYFNDPWVGVAATNAGMAVGGAPAMVPELDAGSKEAGERLGQMYDPIGYLCQDSLSRSEAFLHKLLEAVAAARGAQEAGAATDATSSGSGRRVRPEGEEGDEEEREEVEAQRRRRRAEPRVVLDGFRAHFTKRLAEVTTAQLQLMLNLGASLAAPARTGRPAVDGISWPDSSEQQAALLAAEARRMLADLRAIADAYLATLNALRAPTPQPAAEGGEETEKAAEVVAAAAADPVASAEGLEAEALDEMAAALAANSESAAVCIRNGYKGLLYAVLLRSLVTQIAQQREEEEREEQEQLQEEKQEDEVERAEKRGEAGGEASGGEAVHDVGRD